MANLDKPISSSRRKFIKRAAITAAAAIPALAYGHYAEGNELEVVRTYISARTWPDGTGSIRIGFLSDFHCDSNESLDRVKRAAGMLIAEKPDAVLLGGDYVTHDAATWITPVTQALAPLASAPLGTYAVLGNHDWWSGGQDILTRQLERVGIRMLRNSAAPLNAASSVWLIGLDDRTVNKQDVAEALRGVPPNATKLLLVHEPDYADEAPNGFSLQLSGHSHAGQVRIFGQPIHTPYLSWKYKQGLEQSKNHPIYTTRGVGMVWPKVRFDCRPEVTLITIGP